MYEGIFDAIDSGNLETFKILVDFGAIIDIHAIDYAIRTNQLEIVKHMFETGNITNGIAMDFAAIYGQLEILKYLVSVNADIDDSAVELADRNGEYDILRYLLVIGAPRSPKIKYDLMLASYYRLVSEIMNQFILPDLVPIIISYLQKK